MAGRTRIRFAGSSSRSALPLRTASRRRRRRARPSQSGTATRRWPTTRDRWPGRNRYRCVGLSTLSASLELVERLKGEPQSPRIKLSMSIKELESARLQMFNALLCPAPGRLAGSAVLPHPAVDKARVPARESVGSLHPAAAMAQERSPASRRSTRPRKDCSRSQSLLMSDLARPLR